MEKNKICERRKELGLKQYELAKMLGVTNATVWNWEHDKKRPPFRKYAQIAKALECRASDLIEM